ncbi:MAG: M15 family metallopeptidase [Deltaproteobacteria bacterium]|nr:M15 family metallopeptidase [Deltaproteobacteria bacterium]
MKKIKRRDFLKGIGATILSAGLVPDVFAEEDQDSSFWNDATTEDRHIRDYLFKMKHFNDQHPEDVFLSDKNFKTLETSLERLKRLQRTVGHGNFYLLNFDEALKIARNYTRVGSFAEQEIAFLERIFYEDSITYGFLGEKPLKNLTDRIKRQSVVKIRRTGNYLYRGLPLATYQKIRKDIGDQVILTSGVRSVIKQFMLFLSKAHESRGNLSMASRSLAPPGYSYHGIGDFDVGQVGFGVDNFTEKFAGTDVFRKLKNLGYIQFRYQNENLSGVRFEPWHVKVPS